MAFPAHGVVLRLAKKLNTLVENLYYEIYAAEQYVEQDLDDG